MGDQGLCDARGCVAPKFSNQAFPGTRQPNLATARTRHPSHDFATLIKSRSRVKLAGFERFVVAGYVPSHLGIDSLVVGFYRGKDFIYPARVRAGLVPAARRQVFERIST